MWHPLQLLPGHAGAIGAAHGRRRMRVLMVPCSGRSAAGWQFMQREFMMTFAASPKSARERHPTVADIWRNEEGGRSARSCAGAVAAARAIVLPQRPSQEAPAQKAHRHAILHAVFRLRLRCGFNILRRGKVAPYRRRGASLDRPKSSLYNRARSAPGEGSAFARRFRRPGSSVGRALH